MKKDCCLSLRQESNQIPKYRGYDERQQPMLKGIYAVYTIGLGTKNATVFSMIVVTLGVSHCKYTLIFHFPKISLKSCIILLKFFPKHLLNIFNLLIFVSQSRKEVLQ